MRLLLCCSLALTILLPATVSARPAYVIKKAHQKNYKYKKPNYKYKAPKINGHRAKHH